MTTLIVIIINNIIIAYVMELSHLLTRSGLTHPEGLFKGLP
jgi:hypothetical protein